MLFFNRKLFRGEAVANRWQSEPLDGLLRVTAPHEWLVVGSFALALLGVLAWGVFGRVERSVLADCVATRAGERHAVLADAAGTVTEVLVAGGDQVAAGGPIARMQRPALNWRVRVARAQVALLAGASGEQERAALAAAQAELLELESIAAAGALLVSPWAGETHRPRPDARPSGDGRRRGRPGAHRGGAPLGDPGVRRTGRRAPAAGRHGRTGTGRGTRRGQRGAGG